MHTKNATPLFTSILEKHKDDLEKWAYAQTKDEERAKDLLQEVYIKIYLFTSKEYAKSNDIKNIDNYIWSIAWNTLSEIHRKSNKQRKASKDSQYIDYFQHNLPYIDPLFDEDNPLHDKTAEYAKLRQFILRLDFLEREITIMHYWDRMTAKEIATKLKMSLFTVKSCIVHVRRRLKTLLSSENTSFADIARPRKLFVSCFGDLQQEKYTDSINDDILKQNICLACFGTPKSINELLDIICLAKPYLEPELQWLINKGFLAKQHGRYRTQFFIFTTEVYKEIASAFEKSHSTFFEALVHKLLTKQEKIKSIGFYGANWSFDKLLWFLIPNLVKYIINAQGEHHVDTAHSLPIGYERLSDNDDIKLLYGEKYADLAPWNKIGYQEFDDDILTFGLIQHGISYKNELSHIIVESGSRYNDLFVRLFTKKTTISELGKSDREALDNMVRWGLWAIHDERYIVPQFCVFTESQHCALNDIFNEIASELQDELVSFHKIKKICDSYLDTSMRGNVFFIISNLYVSTAVRFAVYNGSLYKPSNERECAYLSLMVSLKN